MRAVKSRTPNTKINNNVELAQAVIENTNKVYEYGKNFWRRHFAYSITISEKDSLYGEVFEWLFAIAPDEKHRALLVSTSKNPRGDESSPASGDFEQTVRPLTIRYDEGTEKNVRIQGFPVHISVQTPEISEKLDFGSIQRYSKIVFVMNSHAAQKAVLGQLEDLNKRRVVGRKPNLKMVNQWHNWSTRSDLPPRTMESVALPPEQKKRIIDDLGSFLEAEDQYNRLAIPWHRGYMFEGPPGTGKTSLVKALANEFNLDLWYVSLSDLKAEASLISLLADVGPRSLLLLEDIDTIKITHDRDNATQGQISMSSLLNTLDGVATPHGLITVMTTNRIEALDPALTRSGRMDLIEHLGYPTVSTLSEMFRHFYKMKPNWRLGDYDKPIEGLATSQVAEIMKRNLNNPKTASTTIVKMIREARNS